MLQRRESGRVESKLFFFPTSPYVDLKLQREHDDVKADFCQEFSFQHLKAGAVKAAGSASPEKNINANLNIYQQRVSFALLEVVAHKTLILKHA